ncbi:hypothetical protein ZEAMMB73_Zm00001d011168 [Zea mays]|uniref:Uncharacterized protein n=1 Tax=Zea mays TaxID=4577 RepID=A0A1D6FXJ3_MAIZE|nr:hypothetical protein ZEAMMB73_Zm00001d011168 [Zea mays]
MVYKFVVLLWACKKGQFYVLNLFPNIQAEFDLGTRYNMSYLRDFTTKIVRDFANESLPDCLILFRGTHTHALAPIVPYSMENSVADAMYNKIIVFVFDQVVDTTPWKSWW